MSLLSVVKDVCATVGVTLPTSVFSGITTNRTMQEMVTLANEMAQRIAYDYREWTALRKFTTITGDGTATSFDLPANFKRMLLTASVWRSTSALQPMMFISDTDEWLQRRALNRYSAWGEWTMMGGQIHIWPVLSATETATYAYLDKNCVSLASGGFGSEFLNDLDTFVLDDRLLKLGMLWQWKAQKGGPYAEDMNTYGDALTVAMGKDSPSPILVDRAVISKTVRVAYPYPVPT